MDKPGRLRGNHTTSPHFTGSKRSRQGKPEKKVKSRLKEGDHRAGNATQEVARGKTSLIILKMKKVGKGTHFNETGARERAFLPPLYLMRMRKVIKANYFGGGEISNRFFGAALRSIVGRSRGPWGVTSWGGLLGNKKA